MLGLNIRPLSKGVYVLQLCYPFEGTPGGFLKVNVEDLPRQAADSPKVRRGKEVALFARMGTSWTSTFDHIGQFQGNENDLVFIPDGIFSPEETADLGADYPNPIQNLYSMLMKEGEEGGLNLHIEDRVWKSFVHCDLNLENILVQDIGLYPFFWLVDFEKSQGDFYPSFDFIKLEIEISNHLLASQYLGVKEIVAFEEGLWSQGRSDWIWDVERAHRRHANRYFSILHFLRKLAAHYCLPNMQDYAFGLMVYALSTLKFRNLPPWAHRAAYIKAAVAMKRAGLEEVYPEESRLWTEETSW